MLTKFFKFLSITFLILLFFSNRQIQAQSEAYSYITLRDGGVKERTNRHVLIEYTNKHFHSSQQTEEHVSIQMEDHGPGTPDDIKDKIFQPFFTTKPTGQGTGLGLSLSDDIVKAPGSELKVKRKEREGSKFSIGLPG